MLRRDSKWTLQVRKPVTKKSICHGVWLRFAGKSAFGQLQRRNARQRTEHFCKKRPPNTIDWTHNGDAVEFGCRGTANLQFEGRCLRGAALPPPAPGRAEWVLRAPRSLVRPKRRARSAPSSGVPLPLRRAEAHYSHTPAPAPRLWGQGRVEKART